MMKHGIFTFVLIFSGYFVSFCQVINNVPDSLPSLASLAVDLKPGPKVTSYIVPAVFIGYGLVTLTGDNAIRRLDYDTHAALAFMTAEYLHQEYKDQSIWYSIGGYAIATSTGILRLYNNAHWVSDVVAGAGFGILSTKLTYLVYPYIKRKLFHGKPADLIISPGYQNGNMSFSLLKRLY